MSDPLNYLSLAIEMGKYPDFILSTGCDMPENTHVANIRTFFQPVRDFYNG